MHRVVARRILKPHLLRLLWCPLSTMETIWHFSKFTFIAEDRTVYSLTMVWLTISQLSVQFSLVTQSCPTLCDPLSITNSRSLLKLMPIESVMPSSHLIFCRPLLLLPPIPPSIRVFSSESTLRMRWPKYWSFSFSINPSNEHPGLISFRMDWSDLLAVQGISQLYNDVKAMSAQ